MQDLNAYRQEIDRIDAEIVTLLAQRIGVGRKVAAFKQGQGIPVRIPARIEAVREGRAAHGASLGLRADYVRALYDLIIEEMCLTEEREMAGHTTVPAAQPAGG
jgi:chorismate mutase-like protein